MAFYFRVVGDIYHHRGMSSYESAASLKARAAVYLASQLRKINNSTCWERPTEQNNTRERTLPVK